MSAPVISEMTGQMLGTMKELMANDDFRHDMALFALGTMDEMVYDMMLSMQKQEPTFIGTIAEVVMTGGAEQGSDEYNQAMGMWMQRFGPAMQHRQEAEAAAESESEEASQQAEEEAQAQTAAELDQQRQQELGVYEKYNYNTREYELVYRDRYGREYVYEPGVS